MAQPIRTDSHDSADGIRKRVCKACDRCRLKKSKCDGSSPCSRCRVDNAICVFGERKKSHDKVYPKGYVEMLEQQQSQLVSGLQEMYRRLVTARAWSGAPLSESNGHPLTHEILAALNLLETRQDGSGELEVFEEDCQKLQRQLLADGAGYVRRRGSFSSDSEHSQHGHSRPASMHLPKGSIFRESFAFSSNPATPMSHSPAPKPKQSFPVIQQSALQQDSPVANDPQFYQAEWAYPDLLRSNLPTQSLEAQQTLSELDALGMQPFDVPTSFDYTSVPMSLDPQYGLSDFGTGLDPTDLEFSSYIQIQT